MTDCRLLPVTEVNGGLRHDPGLSDSSVEQPAREAMFSKTPPQSVDSVPDAGDLYKQRKSDGPGPAPSAHSGLRANGLPPTPSVSPSGYAPSIDPTEDGGLQISNHASGSKLPEPASEIANDAEPTKTEHSEHAPVGTATDADPASPQQAPADQSFDEEIVVTLPEERGTSAQHATAPIATDGDSHPADPMDPALIALRAKATSLQEPEKVEQIATSKSASIAAAAALDDVLVGTRVSEGHENFVTAYNMLTGIRYAVSRCTAKINRDLIDSDFTACTEISFDMSGQNATPSTKFMFRFKDYSPWVFRHLRELFGLDPADYLMSMTAKYIVSELGSPGKSGSFFYYSRDYRFIIKTIHHSEHKRLRQILKEYYRHVRQYPNTLISQFYGLHRVRLPFGRKIHFVVMNNVFPALYEVHRRYDLKGSTLGRMHKESDRAKPIVVYKDLDWLKNHERIVLGPTKREEFLKQLEKDVQMLQRANVMDYSLLIGIHDMAKGNAAMNALVSLKQFGPTTNMTSQPSHVRGHHQEQNEFAQLQRELLHTNPTALTDFTFTDDFRSKFAFYREGGGYQSTDPNDRPRDIIYYMGVIDFLTVYSFRKRMETFFKGLVHKRSELSAVPSFDYGERFMRFMRMAVGSPIRRRSSTDRAGEGQHPPPPGLTPGAINAIAAAEANGSTPNDDILHGGASMEDDDDNVLESDDMTTAPPSPASSTPSLVRVVSATSSRNHSLATAVTKNAASTRTVVPASPSRSADDRVSVQGYR